MVLCSIAATWLWSGAQLGGPTRLHRRPLVHGLEHGVAAELATPLLRVVGVANERRRLKAAQNCGRTDDGRVFPPCLRRGFI